MRLAGLLGGRHVDGDVDSDDFAEDENNVQVSRCQLAQMTERVAQA